MFVDHRTTAQVEKTRCMRNRKPYRTDTQRQTAREMVRKVAGTYQSSAPEMMHQQCSCGRKRADFCGNVNGRV